MLQRCKLTRTLVLRYAPTGSPVTEAETDTPYSEMPVSEGYEVPADSAGYAGFAGRVDFGHTLIITNCCRYMDVSPEEGAGYMDTAPFDEDEAEEV